MVQRDRLGIELIRALGSPGTLYCVLGLDTLPSQCLSSSRGITSQFIAGNPAVDSQPNQGGVEILLVASCRRNWDKCRCFELL